MLLSDLTLPMRYEDCRDLAVVYSHELAVLLYGIQQEHGDPRHVPSGLPLADGRWAMTGGVLSEVGAGGILERVFAHITPEMMAGVEVVPAGELSFAVPQLVPEAKPVEP